MDHELYSSSLTVLCVDHELYSSSITVLCVDHVLYSASAGVEICLANLAKDQNFL